MTLSASANDAQVTMDTLLREMTDLSRLATLPDPAYITGQFSSYDRRATDPDVQTDENWYANGDRGNHLRVEERNGAREYVMADTQGPGAIVRIWSANPDDAGILRIYIDGAEEPAIEASLSDFLGGRTDLTPEPIGGMRSRGWNSYLPIPYAASIKITASEPNFYYLINYRTYDAGATVAAFDESKTRSYARAAREVAEALKTPYSAPARSNQVLQSSRQKLALPGSGKSVLYELTGPAAIFALTMKVEADDLEAALRGILLRITFDDQDRPAVEVPAGDFFGTAPGINNYQSLPSGVLPDGTLYSHWVMPFEQSATVELENTTADTIVLDTTAEHQVRPWTEASLYFHAQWRPEFEIETRPRQDWNFVDIKGAGRFVGDMLHVANPVADWWGEGDEKIYIDNEKFPSHFGTGSEDYYGYAWCDNQPFTHAYHNQPRCDGPGNYGHTCVSRFHILDDLPFNEALSFNMEVWHWADTTIDQAATSYWYATATSSHNVPRPKKEDLRVPEIPPLPEPERVDGALEGEDFKVIAHSGGKVQVQQGFAFPWSGAAQTWWIDATPGDTLQLGFDVEKAGRYKVLGVFTKAIDYGICTLRINGETAKEDVDFWNDGVIASPEISLGAFDLKKGQNVLEVEIAGTNPKAQPARHMFGVDYLLLNDAK
jgi:hypothetical protein